MRSNDSLNQVLQKHIKPNDTFQNKEKVTLITCVYCKVELPAPTTSDDLSKLIQDHMLIHCSRIPKEIKIELKLKVKNFSAETTQKYLAAVCPISGNTKLRDDNAPDLGSVRQSCLNIGPIYYHDYLQLDKILSGQQAISDKIGKPAHDEHLFIVIHQTYELWFKQILYELDTVRDIFKEPYVDEKNVGKAVQYLNRVSEIFRVVNSQLTILETMTPLGFLDFRDILFPASGFQSVQFRKLEIKLGLLESERVSYGKRRYCSYLSDEHSLECNSLATEESIHDLIAKWLERTPFLEIQDFSFWKHYENAVHAMKAKDEAYIVSNPSLSKSDKACLLEELKEKYKHYEIIYNKEEYNKLKEKGSVRLSQRAMQAALLIMLYQDEPILYTPNKLLMLLFDIDQHLTQWRYRHASMVHRMIGSKMGTGGSSGYHYLRATASKHRIFKDLFQLPTFLIPSDGLPPLPENVARRMTFPA